METTISRTMLRTSRRVERCPASGKIRYRAYKKALRFKERSSAMLQRPLFVYACPDCEGYHLTKRPRGPRK